MEINNITYQPHQSSKKKHKIKEHLSQLASKIKIRMDENQILMETINTVCINIKKNRQQLKKFSSNQSKENIKTELNKNILNLKNNNKTLLIQKKMLFHKYIKLKNKYYTELEPIYTELKLLNDRKFIMENIIKKKDFEIENNQKNLDLFIQPLVREDTREIYSNNIDNDEVSTIYIYILDSSSSNNSPYKFFDILEKNNLNKLIQNLKENNKRNKINKKTIEQNLLSKKITNKEIIINPALESIDDNADNTILNDIMNDTINSEYEEEENTEFIWDEKNYKPIILTPNLLNKIPKINLEQIEYNKMKFKQEDAEKSLSRELKNFDEIDTKKELIKSLIKKEKAKNKKLSNKYLNLIKKINMMKKIINSMQMYNYKLSMSALRDKKIGNINIERQLNALSGRNREITNFKLGYGNIDINNIVDGDKNNKNIKEIKNDK